MAFRVLDDDISDTPSIASFDTKTIIKPSSNSELSKQASELNEDTDEEVSTQLTILI